MMAMLPENMNSKLSWDSVQSEFGSTESIFVAFGKKNENIFNQKAFSHLWELTNALQKIDEVEKVTSISSIPKIESTDGFLEIIPLQPKSELSESQIDDIVKYLNDNSSIKKRSVSRNDNYFNVLVQPTDNIPHNILRDAVVQVGDSLLSKNYEIHYGGTAYITGSVPGMIKKDISMLLFIGLALMSIVLLFNIRNLFAVGMIFSIIIQSLLVMSGMMGWITHFTGSENFYFTIINSSMPIILLTIANSDGVHFVTKFFKEMRKTGDAHQSVSEAMDTLLIPIFLTSITTIAAFLALYFAPIKQLMGYGICLSIGIFYAFILSLTFLPAALSLKKWELKSLAISRASFTENLMKAFGQVVVSKPKNILLIGFVTMLIGIAGLNKLVVDVNIANFFKEDTEFRNSIDFIDEQMTGTMDIRVRVEGNLKDPLALYEVEKIQTLLEKNSSVTTSFSIADALKQMHRILMDDDPEFDVIPEEKQKVSNLLLMYSMSGDYDDLSSMVDYNYNTGLITALSSVMSTDQIISFVKEIEYFVSKLKEVKNVSVTGMAVVIRDLIFLVIESSVLSISFSMLIICVITSLFFRSITWGFLSIVPLAAAVLINFGFMGISGIYLSHVTALLSSVIIGVGVDFSIHYIYQYKRLSKEASSDKISKNVINEVGYPIILDSVSNMSFGALLFSSFIPVQYVGGLMVFAMFSTSFGTLTLLASIVHLLKKNKLIGSKIS